jgi:hypothetical protein
MIFGFLGRAHDGGCKMICMFFLFEILELRGVWRWDRYDGNLFFQCYV